MVKKPSDYLMKNSQNLVKNSTKNQKTVHLFFYPQEICWKEVYEIDEYINRKNFLNQ